MTTTYSAHMRAQMAAGFDWTGKTMGLVLLYNAPTIISPGDDVGTPTNHHPYDLTGLLASLGFQEVSTVASPTYVRVTQAVGKDTTTFPGITVVTYGSDWSPIPTGGTAKSVYVAAALFYVVGTFGGVVNPWVMMTTDPVGDVLDPGVRLTGPPDPTTGTPVRRMFSFVIRGSTVDITPQQIMRSPGTLVWESARLTHVYLRPQRVNFIPDPSFEDVGLFGWRSDGAMTRVMGGVDNPNRFFVRTAGMKLQCIPIPRQPIFRFSAFVRKAPASGATAINLGLITLDDSYNTMGTMWARIPGNVNDLWGIYNTWMRIDGIFRGPEDSPAVIPTIVADGPFDCDCTLLEATGALNQYYDGDSAGGLPGDFTWQGVQSQSYSFYYTARNLTAARLFGQYAVAGQLTNTKPALVLDWVPTGSTVMTHWDVLSENDTKHPLQNWGSPLIP
jgi:hypothetical protein